MCIYIWSCVRYHPMRLGNLEIRTIYIPNFIGYVCIQSAHMQLCCPVFPSSIFMLLVKNDIVVILLLVSLSIVFTIAYDGNTNIKNNEFNVDTSSIFLTQGTDSSKILPFGAISNKCYMKLNIEWVVESDSSIYTTPIVDRIYGHRNKHLLSTTFSNYLEVIDQHGQRPPIGWPIEFIDNSKFYSSPFVYDIDQDGIDEFGTSNDKGYYTIYTNV